MVHNSAIKIYDEKTMSIFIDGYYFNIKKGESYNYDDKLDTSRVIPDKELDANGVTLNRFETLRAAGLSVGKDTSYISRRVKNPEKYPNEYWVFE